MELANSRLMERYRLAIQYLTANGPRFLTIALSTIILLTIIAPTMTRAETSRDPALEYQANLVFEAIMSPFCPGRLLRDCPSSAATELKDKIREMLLSGRSQSEILDHLATLYGDGIRSTPPKRGVGLLAWWLPGLFLVAGFVLIIIWLRSRLAAPEAQTEPISVAEREKLDEIVKRLDA